MTVEELVARRDRALGAGAPLFYREPLHIVGGQGVLLTAADGREYIDMYNNVPCVGHANARVVDAMVRQAGTLNVHSRYLHEGIVEFAERLAALHGERIDSVVFSCTGTEANEVALRMARAATGGQGIVCSDAAYHGNSTEVSRLTHVRARSDQSGDVRAIPFPERYRPVEAGLDDAALADAYLARLQRAIDGFAADRVPFAGLLVCSIFANEGLPDVPQGFMSRAADMVRGAGGLVIADEVQAGYCRTGRWWGYEVTDFEPDIVVTGKPMGNGLPLAATAASRELVDGYRAATRYFNTFASSPLQAAVGMAVLDEIEQENLRTRVTDVGAYLHREIERLQPTCAAMGDVRGHGTFVGVDWVTDRQSRAPDRNGAADVVNRLKDKGFLTSNAGAFGNVVKIRPPLVFEMSHAESFVAAFAETLAEIDG